MRVEDIFESVRTSGVFYHGTNNRFDAFDVNAPSINRATNVAGVYFTPSASEADEYGRRIIKAEINPKKPFYSMSKNVITPEMAKVAKDLLFRHTTYKEQWLETAIIPDFIEKGNFGSLSDIDGMIKREILLAGGYDAYVDGRHVAILDPKRTQIKVLKEL